MIDERYKLRNKAVPLVVYCQEENADTNLHNHMDFEVILIRNGKSDFQIGNVIYAVEAGDLIFINPMEVHGMVVDKEVPFAHACICFDCSLILDEKLAEDLKKEDIRIRHIIKKEENGCREFSNLVQQILESDSENSTYVKMEITSYVSLLFAGLMKYGYVNHHPKESKSAVFCSRVLRYISEHYSDPITSREIAEALSYNQSYFCRNFKKNFGVCFSEYLNRHRVTVGRMMLEEGGKSVAQIANTCGFATPAHFSACFKKYIGMLPSEYRSGGS